MGCYSRVCEWHDLKPACVGGVRQSLSGGCDEHRTAFKRVAPFMEKWFWVSVFVVLVVLPTELVAPGTLGSLVPNWLAAPVVGIAVAGFHFAMIVDCLRRSKLEGKTAWMIVLLVGPVIGAWMYYWSVRRVV